VTAVVMSFNVGLSLLLAENEGGNMKIQKRFLSLILGKSTLIMT